MDNLKLKLDFIKRVITDTVEDDQIVENFFQKNIYPTEEEMYGIIRKPAHGQRMDGTDWPEKAHTMIGLNRLNNLHKCLDYVRENNIDGDFIETGVWRGGACIFAKMYCDMYEMDKKIFVADSFIGLPPPELDQDAGDILYTYDELRVSLDEVKSNFKLYGALDENVIFLEGWFSDTLPDNALIQKLSILRMDGDMYKSTMDVFDSCYHKVSSGGQVIIDDWHLGGCNRAVEDFRNKNNCDEEMMYIDGLAAYWIKK